MNENARRLGILYDVEPCGVAHLSLDLPGEKVNKLTTPVMEELAWILEDLRQRGERGEVRGLVILSRKPGTFIVGADIAEIERITEQAEGAAKSRDGKAVFDMIESLPFPTVCAIGGACLGGGYELALACSCIVASDDPAVRVGLPEVQLGIIPGLGGTRRLPRRVGLRAALDMILAGRVLDGRRALREGFVDLLVPKALLEEKSVACMLHLAGLDRSRGRGRQPRCAAAVGNGRAVAMETGRRPSARRRIAGTLLDGNRLGRAFVLARARRLLSARFPASHYPAPHRALEAVASSYTLPRERALENESRLLGEMIVTPASRNLVFLSTVRRAAKSEAEAGGASGLAAIRKVGVLGAGAMGAGIAQVLVGADIPVRLKDVDWASLERGVLAVAGGLRRRVEMGLMDESDLRTKIAHISMATDWRGFATCDLLIEAVPEDLQVKQRTLAEAEEVLRDEALFATNTSSLLVSDVARAARCPERVLGLHFFHPPARMPLVEVVASPRTGAAALASAAAFASRIGKVPVIVRDGPGFLVNRLLMPYLGQALALAEAGLDPRRVDAACEEWGLLLGPFHLLDEIGLDIALLAGERLAAAFPARAPRSNGSLRRLVAEGRLGVKSGLGFYSHPPRRGRGSSRGPVAEDVIDLLVLPIVNEAAQCLEEEVVRSPGEVDLAMVAGAGFPPFRGGPLRYADSIGAPEVCRRLERLAAEHGTHLEPVPHLRDLARTGRRFHM